MCRRLVLAVALAVMLASPLRAQFPNGFTLDATVGPGTSWGGGRNYQNRDGAAAGLTLGIRPAGEATRLFAVTVGTRSAAESDCAPSPPSQGCPPDLPAITHLGLLFGLEQSRSILAFRALAGPAVFGGASGLGGQVQVDAAIGLASRINRAASHVAAVVAARGSAVARFNGETLRLGSVEFGFRLR